MNGDSSVEVTVRLDPELWYTLASIAEREDVKVSDVLVRAGVELAFFERSRRMETTPLEVLVSELRAARAAGWRAPRRKAS